MGQTLHRSIADNPIKWLDLAYRIRSRILFREALIHATGQYNTENVKKNVDKMQAPVRDLLHKKGQALREAVRLAEKRILSYYPTHLQREKTVGRADKDSIGRGSYANDIMSWIGLIVLRHFFAQTVADDAGHNAPDMGKELVDAIMKGGDAYLNRHVLDQFHAYFPMSNKGNSVLEGKIEEMKEFIKKFVVVRTRHRSYKATFGEVVLTRSTGPPPQQQLARDPALRNRPFHVYQGRPR